MDRTLLERKALAELREIASTLDLRGYQRMKKADLVDLIINAGGDSGSGSRGNGDREDGGPDPRAETGDEAADRAGHDDGDRAEGASDDEGQGSATGDTARHDDADSTREEADTVDDERDERQDADRVRTRRVTGEDGQERSRVRERGEPGGKQGAERPSRGEKEPDGSQRSDQDSDTSPRGEKESDGSQRGEGGQRQRDDQKGGGDGGGNRNRNKRDRRRKGRGGGGGGGGQQQQENLDEAEVREGVLDLLPEGYGFLRCTGYLSGNKDVYVSQAFVRRFGLRRGDRVAGPIRRNKGNDKFPALGRVDTVEDKPVSDDGQAPKRTEFKDLTPLFPHERLRLEVPETSPISMRIVDMMAPIGKGQRGLIVSPPKAGKTTILKQLAHAIEVNNPETHLMVLLVDERPEEVTDFQRSTSGEVIASTFDRPAEDHTQAAELCIERAKRKVERGEDVVILLDSITRLGRAYNLAAPASGRILSGGIDSAALYPPKRFFGAARNIEEGGSLTIIATALIETGSKMDEVIFEEFKGTGNMELRLDRRMEQKRIFPAIDIQSSGTRREELLLDPGDLETVWKLRRLLATMDGDAAIQLLIDKLRATKSNDQFLQMIAKSNLQ